LPEKNARTEIFKIHIGNTPNSVTDADYRTLGAEAEGSVISICIHLPLTHLW